QALWLKDKGAPHSAEAAMCKWWAPKLAYDVVHQCLLMFGHGGYDHGPMEQRLRDVLGFQIGDGTAQIMKTIIARARAGREAVPVGSQGRGQKTKFGKRGGETWNSTQFCCRHAALKALRADSGVIGRSIRISMLAWPTVLTSSPSPPFA